MILENSPPPNLDTQKKEIKNIKNIQKERFKSNDKSISDDSEYIENYNNSLKSPQSRRLYKNLENNDQLDTIITLMKKYLTSNKLNCLIS